MDFIIQCIVLGGFVVMVILVAALWTYFDVKKAKVKPGQVKSESKPDKQA